MIYTNMTVRAMKIAYEAHHGQVDKAGVPYVLHPVHLAEQMQDEVSACVALLHDVVEDTPWTFEQLAEEFPPEVLEALRLLTHADEVDYIDYVMAIAENPAARAVKIADLKHNLDESRFCGDDYMLSRMSQKRAMYRKALDYLSGCS